MHRPTLFAVSVPAFVAVIACAGCEQKLTDARYEQLKVGMSDREVEGILRCGGGTDETQGGFGVGSSGVSGSGGADRVYMYKSGDRAVTVTYRDGKAVQFNKTGF